MIAIPANTFQQYTEWARKCCSNHVYPLSIAEGTQPGNIFTDDAASPGAVLFWHYCGFAYLSGNPDRTFLQDIYETFFLNETDRRFLLIMDDSHVIRFFSDKQGISTGGRLEYCYEGNSKADVRYGSNVHLERINRQLLSRIKGRIIPSFSWDDEGRFLEHGFGYVVIEDGEIAAVAFSAAVSAEEIDIGVETKESYRRRGYARLLVQRMCREILEMGKKPVWAHAEGNTSSMRTALSCGFRKCRTNTVIRKDFVPGSKGKDRE